jgi:hypothetical protein
MSITTKFLPAIALVVALSPLAAHASSNPRVDEVMSGSATLDNPSPFYRDTTIDAATHHQAVQQGVQVSEVMPSSSTIDSPSTVYSFANINTFRDSAGG